MGGGKGILALFGGGDASGDDDESPKVLAFRSLRKALKNEDDVTGAEALEEFISCCKDDEDDSDESDGDDKPASKSSRLFD
jgi:hypothetical protein